MRRLKLNEWAGILSVSLSVTWFAIHSQRAMWKFYLQMPGIAAGIFIVWVLVHYTPRAADVRIVYVFTVLINALVYAVLFEIFLWLRRTFQGITRVSRAD
jgi:hypothetical protein